MNETIYAILLWACPVLLGVVAYIGREALIAFKALQNDVMEIKLGMVKTETLADELEERVKKIEKRFKWII